MLVLFPCMLTQDVRQHSALLHAKRLPTLLRATATTCYQNATGLSLSVLRNSKHIKLPYYLAVWRQFKCQFCVYILMIVIFLTFPSACDKHSLHTRKIIDILMCKVKYFE